MPLFALYHKGNSERIYSRKDKTSAESFVPPIDRVSASNAVQARIKFLKKRKEKFSDFQSKYTVKKIGIPNSVDKKQFVKAFNEGKNPFQEPVFVPEIKTVDARKEKREKLLRRRNERGYELDENNVNAKRAGVDDEYVLDRLPESYGPAKLQVNKSENCMGCVHWAARRCHKWEAPVKADYWCKSYEQAEVKLIRPDVLETEFIPLDESKAINVKLDPELQKKIDEQKGEIEKQLDKERERGKPLSPRARKKRRNELRRQKALERKQLIEKIQNGTLTPEEANLPEVLEYKRRRKRRLARGGKRFTTPEQERKRQSGTPKTHAKRIVRKKKRLRYFASKAELEGNEAPKTTPKKTVGSERSIQIDTQRESTEEYIARPSGGGGQSSQSSGGGGGSGY